ncbi:MAG: class I SAM-dependent methyltransferase, partial [Candidatus Bathyarchaeota archaeon]|nr:class I SAM-dependent methyltransferase [Candidatus Bathyarchaeota archaeon]
MDVNHIDWNGIWQKGATFMIGQANKAEVWNLNAEKWNKSQTESDFGTQVIKRLKMHPQWTALDVGAGTGLLALPMAKECKHVTALDASSEMLRFLAQNAKQQGLSNISCVNKLIEETNIGEDIEKHDIVIACRSMGLEQNVRAFLQKMDEAAKRYVYLVWGAQERTFDIALYNAIGRPYGETRTYIILYNLLYQMGIRANIEIFECQPKNMSYPSVEDAHMHLCSRFKRMKMNRELNPTEQRRLLNFLETNLKKTDDGMFTYGKNDYS